MKVGTILPPNCASTQGGCAASTGAIANGTYPFVFNNDIYDACFGITSRIFLDQLTPDGRLIDSLEVPNSLAPRASRAHPISSSPASAPSRRSPFISPPIIAISPSWATSRRSTRSTSRTPTRPSPSIQRIPSGRSSFAPSQPLAATDTSTSPRPTPTAAITAAPRSSTTRMASRFFYTAGNAGNGANPQPDGIVLGAGAQFIDLTSRHEAQQDPGTPTPVASFSVTELGAQGRQDRQGRQLPRHDRLQQRALLHQGQRQQRRQHRLLRGHHRQGLPQRRRTAGRRREASHHAAHLRSRRAPDHRPAIQHVHPRRLPDGAGQEGEPAGLPLRALVRQCDDALRRR